MMCSAFLQTWKLLGLALIWHTLLPHVNYRKKIKNVTDKVGQRETWEGFIERVANGKFPCGLCRKLKAVRGGVGGWEEEGGGTSAGNFHYHPIHVPFQTPATDGLNHGRNALSDCSNSSDIRLELTDHIIYQATSMWLYRRYKCWISQDKWTQIRCQWGQKNATKKEA